MKKKKVSKYYYFEQCPFAKDFLERVQKELDTLCAPEEQVTVRLANTFLEPSSVRVLEIGLSAPITTEKQLTGVSGAFLTQLCAQGEHTRAAEQIFNDSGLQSISTIDVYFASTDYGPQTKKPALLFYWHKQ